MKSQHVNPPGFLLTLFTFTLGILTPAVAGGVRQLLHDHVPTAAKTLKPVDQLPAGKHLSLAIGLPLRNQAELNNLLRDISDPASPNFHHYLTPEQFTEKFGPTTTDYQAVVDFARKHGLGVTNTHPNRLIVDVDGASAEVEKAFGVKMQVFQHPHEARTFYAPDSEPSLDLAVHIAHISGLDNYSLPHALNKVKPLGMAAGTTPQSGSGPSGAYAGGDFRAAYVPGTTLTGAGQSVGLLQFDGYYASDITAYKSLFSLPDVPIVNVPIDGGVTTPGSGNGEVCLDIEMVMSMAPGVTKIYVYEAPNPSPWVDLLNRMANDNLAKQLSCSWGGGSADSTAEAIFQQMAAQGQSFFNASGDSDAFTSTIEFPADSPNITQVGGTTLTTSGGGGAYVSETVWNWGGGVGSSGGISTYYSIPSWQQSVSMGTNQGSTTMRNVPDVALTADNVYVTYNNGGTGAFGGTSCAAPLWAGFTALVNQQAVAAGRPTVGFINPAIYTIGSSSGYSSAFHDTTTGNNFSSSSPTRFSAVSGYDLCTGLGTPVGSALINALAGPPDFLQVSSPSFMVGGDVGGPMTPSTVSYTLTNNGSSSLNWTAAKTQTWTTLSASGGTLAPGANTTVTWSLNSSAVNALTAGNYSDAASFTNSTSGVTQVRTLSMTIVTPTAPTITTASPLPTGYLGLGYSQALAASGGWTPYTWSITSGSLPAGLSLSSAGVISGMPTAATTASFTVQVMGNDGLSSTKNFDLTIAASLGPFFDDFDPGIDMVQWSAFGGTVGSTVLACNYGGSVSGSNSLWFGDAGSRYAASRSLNTTQGGLVDFWLRIANGTSSTWENVDLPGEGIVLEYSIDSGSSWVECGRYDTTAYWVWTHVSVDIPTAARTTNTMFRWRQLSNSGSGFDHWALDDVAVIIGPHGPIITTASPLTSGIVGTSYSQTLAASGGTTPYTWSIASGSLPSGLSLSSAGVISGMPTAATSASFTAQVMGSDSLSSTRNFNLTIGGSLADALDQPTLVVTTSGNLPWFSQNATTHDGVDAAQSGAITDSQQSVMQTTITGPGTFSFWWKVSSEASYDYLTFYLDGVAQSGAISGTVDWQQKSYTVTAGSHTLKWIYSKDSSVSLGSDCAWVDQLTLPQPTAPTITTSSPLTSGMVGTTYNQTLAASGGTTPYTWSITSGSLPAGMMMSLAGVIIGTPPAMITASFTVKVTGSDGQSSTKAFNLTVNAPLITVASFNLNTDPGWTRQGQWAFGTPTGSGGTAHGYPDPTSGATGTNVFGVNLSGDYSTTVGGPWYLTTGPINLTGCTGTQLRFKRWLNTDYASFVYATIDVSTDGTTWTNLFTNSGTAIAENAWSTQTCTLGSATDNNATVYIRWGYQIGSGAYAYSGWNIDDIEFLASSSMTALQTWRQTWFGSNANSGNGADLSDPDHDGIPNLAEFAFGLDPTHNSVGLLPRPQKVGSNYVVSFTEPTGVSGIIYGAEWSQTLLPGSWTPVTDTGVSPQHTFSVPIGNKTQFFMRMKVIDLNP